MPTPCCFCLLLPLLWSAAHYFTLFYRVAQHSQRCGAAYTALLSLGSRATTILRQDGLLQVPLALGSRDNYFVQFAITDVAKLNAMVYPADASRYPFLPFGMKVQNGEKGYYDWLQVGTILNRSKTGGPAYKGFVGFIPFHSAEPFDGQSDGVPVWRLHLSVGCNTFATSNMGPQVAGGSFAETLHLIDPSAFCHYGGP